MSMTTGRWYGVHQYEIGQHVTLTNGMGAIIVSRWWEDSGTPGYGVQLYIGRNIGVHDSHIRGPREEGAPSAGEPGTAREEGEG